MKTVADVWREEKEAARLLPSGDERNEALKKCTRKFHAKGREITKQVCDEFGPRRGLQDANSICDKVAQITGAKKNTVFFLWLKSPRSKKFSV